MTTVKVRKLHSNATLPTRATEGSAGWDLYASETAYIGEAPRAVSTAIALELPPGYEAQVRPRSGSALRGLVVCNAPGTIDSDYRGEVKVILRVLQGMTMKLCKGDRVAQLVIKRVPEVTLVEVDELDDTKRGIRGLGSTGR